MTVNTQESTHLIIYPAYYNLLYGVMGSHQHKLMAYNHVQRQVEFPIFQHIKNRFETIKLYNYKPQSQTVITGHYRTITTMLRLKTPK